MMRRLSVWRTTGAMLMAAIAAPARAGDVYSVTNLGAPIDADTCTAVRMNNLGHVVGYSIHYGQGEPSIRPWVWTPDDGFMVLPPPPDMYLGRARAMDISDTGIVAGDGGFDSGIAWRYEDGVYETFGQVGGMFIAYLGAVNDAGDVAGTAKDTQITTEDEAFLDLNGVGTVHLTPGDAGGRATDVNNEGQVCGYTYGLQAFVWDESNGIQLLGNAGLAYSFAYDMNDLGQVVGTAQSASGNTVNSWIYTPGSGQQVLPTRGATAINGQGHVVGTITCCGPDVPWIWTPLAGTQMLHELVAFPGLSAASCRDINDAGQILLNAYDSSAGGFRPVVLTPVAADAGACCLASGQCVSDSSEAACVELGGTYLGNASQCVSCDPVGACCLTDGDCLPFRTEAECVALAGAFQGDGSSCSSVECPAGVANDDCDDALAIGLGDTIFSTLGASTDGPMLPASCQEPAGTFFGMDIWYRFEPEGDGTLTVSTCDQADYDTRLAAYTGTCDGLQIAGCNDDTPGCSQLTSIMEVPVSCGEPLLIRVGSFSVYTGTGTLTLSFEGDGCTSRCVGDADANGQVDVDDLVRVIVAWGTADPEADLDRSGMVDVDDLLMVIMNWGPC